MKYIIKFFILFLLSSQTNAEKTYPNLDAITSLTVNKLQAVETNGEILFVSDNGRFVIRGQLTDTWHKKSLDTMAEIKYASEHIDIDVMGLPLNQMNTITISGGPDMIIVFVDPQCSYCKSFIKQAKEKTDKFTFKIVVVPALGAKSNILSKSLFCSSEKNNALQMLLDGKLEDMPQKNNCNTKYYDLTLTVAQLFGIKQVPFFISPDGRYKSGAGSGFWEWINHKG